MAQLNTNSTSRNNIGTGWPESGPPLAIHPDWNRIFLRLINIKNHCSPAERIMFLEKQYFS